MVLHLVAYLYYAKKYSYSNARVVMQLHAWLQLSVFMWKKISCTKGGTMHVWRVAGPSPSSGSIAGNLCYTFICMLGTTILNFQCCSSAGVVVRLASSCNWDQHQQSIETKKILKNVGMACQKVCKQGRDDANSSWYVPINFFFSFLVHAAYTMHVFM